MRVTLNGDKKPRKLKAVVGSGGEGVFFANNLGKVFYLDSDGMLIDYSNSRRESSLEKLLTTDDGRKAIYEGDSITLVF